MLKAIVCSAVLLSAGAALAEETTVIRRETTPSVGVVVPAPVESRSTTVTTSTGCDTKVIHKENDLGESKTVKKTDC